MRVALTVLLAALALGAPWLFGAENANFLSLTLCYCIVGVSLVVLSGWAGQISLGQFAFAGIGAATNARMADMLEAHEENMVFARDVLEAKARADERFMRRFQAIVEKHDKNLYGPTDVGAPG